MKGLGGFPKILYGSITLVFFAELQDRSFVSCVGMTHFNSLKGLLNLL